MNSVVKIFAGFSLSLLLLCACSGSAGKVECSGDTLTVESQLLTLVEQDGLIVADVRNPWLGGSELLERYVFAPEGYDGDLPNGVVVTVPVKSSIVYSSVHGGAIAELQAVDAICGVADKQYFITDEIVERINSGRIADVGNSMSVSIERIVDLSPDAILMSPFQNKESGAIMRIGSPVVQCVDYMEPTPLGRAEWIKLLGVLYGRRHEADSIFAAVSAEYTQLRDSATLLADAPKVLPEQPLSSAQWDVPAGESYMARMLRDAAAVYPWAATSGSGSLTLDAATVLNEAEDADYWIIRYFGDLTLKDLRSSNPLNCHFKAFKTGNVYVCNTSVSPLFEEFPFHPERLLREYVKLFHPTALPDYQLRYFARAADN